MGIKLDISVETPLSDDDRRCRSRRCLEALDGCTTEELVDKVDMSSGVST